MDYQNVDRNIIGKSGVCECCWGGDSFWDCELKIHVCIAKMYNEKLL